MEMLVPEQHPKADRGQNEWYTPARYIEAAREVLGEIDLDPASCALANQVVRARQFFTQEENGLMHPWYGRIWLNPPYGRTRQGKGSNLASFTSYLLEQYRRGNVTAAILLIPTNTATRWFEPLWYYPICFPRFRILFNTPRGPSDGPSFGTCFVYLGPHEERFVTIFSRFGPVARAMLPFPGIPINRELWGTGDAQPEPEATI